MTTGPEDRAAPEEITDQMLMAYVDGDPELPPRQRRRIAAAIRRSPELVERMDSFLFTRGPIQRAFDEVLAVPGWLTAAVAGETKATPRRGAKFDLRELLRPGRWGAGMAIAAVGAILIAGPAGWFASSMARSGVDVSAGGLQATGSLRSALEQAHGGAWVPAGRGVELKATATFASVHGSWCRKYLLSFEGNRSSPGLACREGDGNWRVLLQEAAQVNNPDGTPSGNGPQPPANPEGEAFGLYMDQLRRGNTLAPTDEKALVTEERWSRKP